MIKLFLFTLLHPVVGAVVGVVLSLVVWGSIDENADE